jgi:transposase
VSNLYGGQYTLDAIYPHLETLKGSIGWQAIAEFGIDTAVWHWDFTSLSFHGAFEDQESDGPQVTYGHSKARRPDLKQVMVGFGVTGDGAIPLHHSTMNGSTAEVSQVVSGVTGHAKIGINGQQNPAPNWK